MRQAEPAARGVSSVRACPAARRSPSPAAAAWRCLFWVLVFLVLLPGCVERDAEAHYRREVLAIVSQERFSLARWEVGALAQEALERSCARGTPEAPAGEDPVSTYLAVAARLHAVRSQIEAAAAQHADDNAVRQLEEQEQALRSLATDLRPQAERVLEAQFAQVLAEKRIGWFGLPLPPVIFRFTEPPNYLILSPRDEIRVRFSVYLEPGLTLARIQQLEKQLEQQLPNTSALISPTGGFSSWPTMIVDRASLAWIVHTIGHEWVHLYLAPFPLGRAYDSSPDARAINETVADIAGIEIGDIVLQQFHNEFAIPTPGGAERRNSHAVPGPSAAFDFDSEMRLTRQVVERMLAEGRIDEAERYMEARRLEFLAHGYYIRRLNQAYFAFHGTYRTGPAAPPEDPIAPRLRELRARSTDVGDFLRRVRGITTVAELMELVPVR